MNPNHIPAPGLDLDDLSNLLEAQLTLLHPVTQAPTSATITLAGPEHPVRKKIDLDRARRMRQQFAATGKPLTADPVELIDEQTDMLVAATLGWSLTRGGAPLEFSQAAARALYIDSAKQWVRAQVAAGLDKTELFIGSSAKP